MQKVKYLFKLLVALFIFGISPVMAFAADNVTVKFDKAPLAAVLNAIEKQTGRTFSYGNDLIASKVATINMADAPLTAVLDKLCAENNLNYEIHSDVVIILSPKTEKPAKPQAAASFTAKGVVLDENGEPVIGASVIAKGASSGVVTGLDGDFNLANVKKGDVLAVSYVGYQTANVTIKDNTPLKVTLDPTANALEEVVVVGYGVQRKRDVTTSISSV